MRFEIEVFLNSERYEYTLALELPKNFKELRILEERLVVSGSPLYSREHAQIYLQSDDHESKFLLDWHLVALPVIQTTLSDSDPLQVFKNWLTRMIILNPIPSEMSGESSKGTLEPEPDGSNFGEWFSGLLSRYPSAYSEVDKYLKGIMPDISNIQNPRVGKDLQTLMVRFQANKAALDIYFEDLSDGEKCFFISAVVLAANNSYGPLFCFWDEPDNYLAFSEVGFFITALRRSFESGGQFLATSHNYEAIRNFSPENTFVLQRKSHLEPTVTRLLSDVSVTGDLENAMLLGDIGA